MRTTGKFGEHSSSFLHKISRIKRRRKIHMAEDLEYRRKSKTERILNNLVQDSFSLAYVAMVLSISTSFTSCAFPLYKKKKKRNSSSQNYFFSLAGIEVTLLLSFKDSFQKIPSPRRMISHVETVQLPLHHLEVPSSPMGGMKKP